MARKYIDCRERPSEMNCSIVISGEEQEVMRAATDHAVSVHGLQNTPDLQRGIRSSMRDVAGAEARVHA